MRPAAAAAASRHSVGTPIKHQRSRAADALQIQPPVNCGCRGCQGCLLVCTHEDKMWGPAAIVTGRHGSQRRLYNPVRPHTHASLPALPPAWPGALPPLGHSWQHPPGPTHPRPAPRPWPQPYPALHSTTLLMLSRAPLTQGHAIPPTSHPLPPPLLPAHLWLAPPPCPWPY